MRRIGVLTSGGDAPGMNACIRSVVRFAIANQAEVLGIREGFDGLLRGEITPLTVRDVGGILQRGGTVLQTARSLEFIEEKGQLRGQRELNQAGIEGLVVIGGDGSMRGAKALVARGVPVVGVPASIDNDLWGTNMSLGVDTALNTIMEAIDKLRDTASSHQRAFLIEVMGRNCGYLALMGGMIAGAELILIPEHDTSLDEVAHAVADAYARGKNHCIIVAAEGAPLRCQQVADYLRAHEVGFEPRVTILGHIQRGGRPSAFDRILAIRLGVKAVECLLNGESNVMVGLHGREIGTVSLDEVTDRNRQTDLEYYEIAEILAR